MSTGFNNLQLKARVRDAAVLLAVSDAAASPVPSATPAVAFPSPTPSATRAPGPRKLTLNIPPGWRRTEVGHYNEWRSPDGMSNFRVTPMAPEKAFQGPGAADAVKAQFIQTAVAVHPNPNLTVTPVSVCNGTQQAFRVEDPLGLGSAGFMMIIPGVISTGLINYEVPAGQKPDPAILTMLNALCWP